MTYIHSTCKSFEYRAYTTDKKIYWWRVYDHSGNLIKRGYHHISLEHSAHSAREWIKRNAQ